MSAGTAARPGRIGWVPVVLVVLVAIPAAAGVARLVELAGGPQGLPAKPHVTESPLPLVLHILAALPYAVLGALQLSPRLRRNGWHRRVGRPVFALGLLVAASALWMNQMTPHSTAPAQLLHALRFAAGTAMIAFTVLSVVAAAGRDLAGHAAWARRSYAIAMGAVTQMFTIGIGEGLFGPGEWTTALMQGLAWTINLAIAEHAIRSPRRRRQVLPAAGAGA